MEETPSSEIDNKTPQRYIELRNDEISDEEIIDDQNKEIDGKDIQEIAKRMKTTSRTEKKKWWLFRPFKFLDKKKGSKRKETRHKKSKSKCLDNDTQDFIENKSLSQDNLSNPYNDTDSISTKKKRAQFKRTESYYGKSSKKSEIKISSMSLRNASSNRPSKNKAHEDNDKCQIESSNSQPVISISKDDSKKSKKSKLKQKSKSEYEKKKKHGRKGSKDNINLEESNLGDMIVGLNFDDINFNESESEDTNHLNVLSARQERKTNNYLERSKSSSNIGKIKVKSNKNIFEITYRLGKGSFGIVWCGLLNDKRVALKQIDFSTLSDKKSTPLRREIKREVDLLKTLEHKNIIRYDGLYYNKQKKEINVVMELVEGASLTDIILYIGKLGEDVSACMIKQILNGLNYLHENNLIHRDIKPDNILVDISSVIKIIDFGTVGFNSNDLKRRSAVGTPWYCAPEVINTEEYNWSVDIWSLGCIMIELITGKPPYDDLSDIPCLVKMASSPPPIPDDLSSECYDFISKCLDTNKLKRPTAKELLSHPYILAHNNKEQNLLAHLQTVIEEMQESKEEE